MPLPIWPAPTMPILRMVIASVRSLRLRSLGRSLTSTILAYLRYPEPYLVISGRGFRSALDFVELTGELRQRRIEIRHQSIIGDLKDRRFLILVDRDDDFRIFHAGEMLNGTRYADGDIKVRRHHFAGLANLPIVRRVAGIDRGARGADRGAELIRHRLYIFGEVVAALHRPAAGNDDLGRGQFRPLRFRQLLADEAGNARIGRGGSGLDGCRTALDAGLACRRPYRDHFLGIVRAHG